MEIHQLEYFVAIHRYGSFSTAALEIRVSQSTLSQQIQKLEDSLGVKLFIRDPRVIRLSPAGAEFVAYAQQILADLEHAREAMQAYTSYHKGRLYIGMIPTSGYLGFHRIVTEFIKAYPGIEIEIDEANTDELLKGLQEKRINVAFITAPLVDGNAVDFHPLVEDEVVALVPIRHPLAARSPIAIEQLADADFLMMKASTGYRQAIVTMCQKSGFQPRVILDGAHVEILQSFVEEGIGILLTGLQVAQQVYTSNTAIVRLRDPMAVQNGLAICRYGKLPLATRLFRDLALRHFAPNPPVKERLSEEVR